jgi:hypothetical protein
VTIRRGSAAGKHTARHAWLSEHRHHMDGVPGIDDDVTDIGRARLDALTDTMKSLGLIGASTREVQRETVRRLVSDLRGEKSGATWW